MKFKCSVCGFVFDEEREGRKFADLPESWACPVCAVSKKMFEPMPEEGGSFGARAEGEGGAKEKPGGEQTRAASDSDSGGEAGGTQTGEGAPRTVADALIGEFASRGLKWVFGMVGHSNLGLAEAVRKQTEKGALTYVGIRHEGAAAFACSGYGKLTGRPAACLSIAGPGATNMLTGLCDARCDGAPAIALTGQVPSGLMGAKLFQDIDLNGVYSCAEAFVQTAYCGSDGAALARRAWNWAVANGGVSQLVVPDDAQVSPAGKPADSLETAPVEIPAADSAAVKAAAEFIAGRMRPVIVLGWGARGAVREALELAQILQAPILTTYRAKGFIPDSHPLACGVVGLSGTSVANTRAALSDCIIGVGMGFSKHTAISVKKPVVRIDCDLRALGARRRSEYPLLGDAAKTLAKLAEFMPKEISAADSRAEIAEAWRQWRAQKAQRAAGSLKGEISPTGLSDALSKFVPEDAIVSVDVGNLAYSVGRAFESKRQTFLLSFYLGSIGVGLPSAIGAWCATREKGSPHFGKKVVAMVGDGGLGQYLSEWTTVVKNGMDIKCVVFDNSELAKISLEEKSAKMQVWQTELRNPDFAEFSRLCGGKGFRIEDVSELDDMLSQAFATEGPVMIDVLTSAQTVQ